MGAQMNFGSRSVLSLVLGCFFFGTDDDKRRPDVFSALKLGKFTSTEGLTRLKRQSFLGSRAASRLTTRWCRLRKPAARQRDLGGGSPSGELVQSGGSVSSHDGRSQRTVAGGPADGGEECRRRQTRRRPRLDRAHAGHLPRVRQVQTGIRGEQNERRPHRRSVVLLPLLLCFLLPAIKTLSSTC